MEQKMEDKELYYNTECMCEKIIKEERKTTL